MRKLHSHLNLSFSPFAVELPACIADGLLAEAERKKPLETGGVLMGVWDGRSCKVEALVGPGPNAIHDSTSFVPDYAFQTDEIAKFYQESGRTLAYVGDWHTHPGKALYLSPRDKKTLRRIGGHRPARCPRPLMLVVGGNSGWSAGAWIGERSAWGAVFTIRQINVLIDLPPSISPVE